MTERYRPLRPFTRRIVARRRLLSLQPVDGRILSAYQRLRANLRAAGLRRATGKGILKRLVLREAKHTGSGARQRDRRIRLGHRLGHLATVLTETMPEVQSVYATFDDRPEACFGKPLYRGASRGPLLCVSTPSRSSSRTRKPQRSSTSGSCPPRMSVGMRGCSAFTPGPEPSSFSSPATRGR